MLVLRPVLDPFWVAYGFGDAAREGTGRLIVRQSARDHVRVRMAFWCSEHGENTSNNREFRNLKDMVIDEAKLGSLTGHEVFLRTDSQVAENVWHKGSSKERNMYEMMLEICEAAIKFQFLLHFVHVAGTRMIEVGVDGISGAELDVGKLTNSTTIWIPMHLSPVQRNDLLHTWISSWISEPLHFAEPHDWFEEDQQIHCHIVNPPSQVWIWDLPPAAALDVLEELVNGRLKRHETILDIAVIPLILNTDWFKCFLKTVDFYFFVHVGAIPAWPSSMHEGLTIGLYFPLLRYEPWDWKNVPFMGKFGSTLSALYHTNPSRARDLLREFWKARTWVATMSQRMVSSMLSPKIWHRLLSVYRIRSSVPSKPK
jgi:hypothetical protein